MLRRKSSVHKGNSLPRPHWGCLSHGAVLAAPLRPACVLSTRYMGCASRPLAGRASWFLEAHWTRPCMLLGLWALGRLSLPRGEHAWSRGGERWGLRLTAVPIYTSEGTGEAVHELKRAGTQLSGPKPPSALCVPCLQKEGQVLSPQNRQWNEHPLS